MQEYTNSEKKCVLPGGKFVLTATKETISPDAVHLTKMQELYTITAGEEQYDEIYTVSASGPRKMMKELKLWNSSKIVNWQVDTGATCKVIPFKEYVRVTGDRNGKKLDANSIRIDTYGYGGTRIRVAGSTDLQFKDLRGKKYSMRIVVVHLDANPLLSLQAD